MVKADYDRGRETAAARGYGSRWRRARLAYLREHPLCVMCQSAGRVMEAQVVDHIRPHRGDPHLMWDRGNWQSLCKRHHDGAKQRIDRAAAAASA
ncbi:HNH endonuclease signature motif containing protein [Tistrella bauzanensis]|uniref:HNH endonuclease signature motif containing protein n=1 Tax=Tistrella TaxID=171436 RepID=UPI0031F63A1C